MSTAVLLTVVIGAIPLVAGAFSALVTVLGTRITSLETSADIRFGQINGQLQRVEERLSDVPGVHDDLVVVRASLAGLDSRVATIEQRLA